MNRTIIENVNARVGPKDTLYNLGDLAWSLEAAMEFFEATNVGTMVFLKGNHDQWLEKLPRGEYVGIDEAESNWHFISQRGWGFHSNDYIEFNRDKRKVVLFHYPIWSWNKKARGSYHLHGHIHSTSLADHDPDLYRLDVGVDAHDFYPWSWDEIQKFMNTRTGKGRYP